ncbi:unnamed protein product, partial [Polarella glacialis]
DPRGAGPLAVCSFGATSITVKLLKRAVSACARFSGIDGPLAFWRRPAAAGRAPDSPGFPSGHTASAGSVAAFVAAYAGWPLTLAAALAAVPTLAMACARVGDSKHTRLQTAAGALLGPPLGLALHCAAE